MPTLKQKRAAKKMLENGGIASTAMLEAGYSPSMSKNPQKMTESAGFKEALDELLPKDLIRQTHRKIILKKDKDGQPHSDAVKGVDMAYKLDGSYAPDKSISINVEAKANPIVEELAEKLNAILKGTGVGGDGTPSGTMGVEASDKE